MKKIYQSTEKLINDAPTGIDNYGLSRVGSESEVNVAKGLMSFELGMYDMPRNRRPVSMFINPWLLNGMDENNYHVVDDEDNNDNNVSNQQHGFSSLPPDLINQITPDQEYLVPQQLPINSIKTCWEAEDADDYIATLDETTILDIESLENVHAASSSSSTRPETSHGHLVKVDVHKPLISDMYATVQKKSNDNVNINETIGEQSNLNYSPMPQEYIDVGGNNVHGQPIQKIPKIMTTSCYGGLNFDASTATITQHHQQQHHHQQQQQKQTMNIMVGQQGSTYDTQILIQPTSVDAISMTNSIADEFSSLNSSIFEPNSLISSVDLSINPCSAGGNGNNAGSVVGVASGKNEKGRVKWWDQNQFIHNENEDVVQEIANQGKCTDNII